MYLDFEANQLKMLLLDLECLNEVITIGGNSFCHKILHCLNKPQLITDNSDNDCPPPDFYSGELNIMFDLFKVNDSEVERNYNPTKKAERNMEKRIRKSWIAEKMPNAVDNLFCIAEDWGSDIIHNIDQYTKNIKRVIDEHLSSKGYPNKIQDIWIKNHPHIGHKGFVVFDETENYCTAIKYPHPYDIQQCLWIWKKDDMPRFYEPWTDYEVMSPIYESDIDFVVWYNPYKPLASDIVRIYAPHFPRIVVVDTRFPNKLIHYNYKMFTRC